MDKLKGTAEGYFNRYARRTLKHVAQIELPQLPVEVEMASPWLNRTLTDMHLDLKGMEELKGGWQDLHWSMFKDCYFYT